jgi:hypothetical protein
MTQSERARSHVEGRRKCLSSFRVVDLPNFSQFAAQPSSTSKTVLIIYAHHPVIYKHRPEAALQAVRPGDQVTGCRS